MLFNAPEFLFGFLPLTLVVFFALGMRGGARLAAPWLVAASLFFYGWWNPAYLTLIVASIAFNYGVGAGLTRLREPDRPGARKLLLALGVAANLGALGWFKYAGFFVDNLNVLLGGALGWGLHLERVILPLAISFFTFQQVAYLVDTARGEARERSLLHYCLFVTFFPQLIAGPIVHHDEVLPQLRAKGWARGPRSEDLALGATTFTAGLFKKVVFADTLALSATPVFSAVAAGTDPTFAEAWVGTLAYTLQLYFDFSGYSDMAIGLGRMFGVKLPVNFDSPYQATNIADFWRRWHITLSRFLRDYLYIPLGGNRRGRARRYVNLMITMLLGGLWHGAGWTFVIWGGLHGAYLAVQHAWSALWRAHGGASPGDSWAGRVAARALTFFAVIVGWVFFRAADVDAALVILQAMSGLGGLGLADPFANHVVADAGTAVVLIVGLLGVALVAPNTQQLVGSWERSGEPARALDWLRWRPSPLHAALVGVLFFVCFSRIFAAEASEFLYFQF